MNMPSLRKALEEALAENPDDRAAHAAYADLLMEQNDPRGEFIQVQLALEDEARPAAFLRRLREREAELVQAHQHAWLGDLARFLLDEKDVSDWRRQYNKVGRWRWARGWLEELYLWSLDVSRARALARAPAAHLLRRLHIEHSGYESDYEAEADDGIPEGSEYPCLYPLQREPFLPHPRVFQLGETVDFEDEMYNCQWNEGRTAPPGG
jgi:uncharacterized protein (TIGR02996 family)